MDTPITTPEQLASESRRFVKDILNWFRPGSVPLCRRSQASFIDMCHRRAHRLADNKPHLEAEILEGLKEYQSLRESKV